MGPSQRSHLYSPPFSVSTFSTSAMARSAATSPLVTVLETSERCLSGAINISIAVIKETNPPAESEVVWL